MRVHPECIRAKRKKVGIKPGGSFWGQIYFIYILRKHTRFFLCQKVPSREGQMREKRAIGVCYHKNMPYPDYTSKAKAFARKHRNNSTKSEILLWCCLRRKQLGVRFIRQKPIGP